MKKRYLTMSSSALKRLFGTPYLANKIFQHYILLLTREQWLSIGYELIISTTSSTDHRNLEYFFFKNMHSWRITDKNLRELDKEYPDELYFCGNTLAEFLDANQILGYDMLLTLADLDT